MWRFAAVVLALMAVSAGVAAFEVKGYSPGKHVTQLDLTGCKQLESASSVFVEQFCSTTLGGNKATLLLRFFDSKLVALSFTVQKGVMQPVLDALTTKYGAPTQEQVPPGAHLWRKDNIFMEIREDAARNGFQLMLVDRDLLVKARKADAEKAKKDL